MGNCCVRVKLARNRMTQRKRRRTIVLLLVGLDKAGKTTAAKGIVGELMNDTVPTVGFSTFTQSYKGYSVVMYDLGGGPQIRGIWNKYFIDVHGIIYVVDASDTTRIDESRVVLEQLLTHDKLAGKPLLLLANKQDCEGALDEIDVVERLKLEKIVNQQKCPTLVETCSAFRSKNAVLKSQLDPGIQNGYRWLLSIIIKEFKDIDARVQADTEIAKIQLDIEKMDRKNRIDQQRREKEELESTIIIPLKDDYPGDGQIIQVKSTSVAIDPSGEAEANMKIHQSDSHDSGYTVQHVEDYEDVGSLESVLSQDSALQSVAEKEYSETVEENKNSSTKDSGQKTKNNGPSLPKPSKFLRHSNKTAPAPTGVLLLGNTEFQNISSAHRKHKLPPLTPPACHTKMFEAKSAKSIRLPKSHSLSSDDSDEKSDMQKGAFCNAGFIVSGPSEDLKLQASSNCTADTDATTIKHQVVNGSLKHPNLEVNLTMGDGDVHQDIYEVFTIKSPDRAKDS